MGTNADISKMMQGLKDAQEKIREAATKAMDQFGEHVIGDAQQLTPVKTGALQASGTTEPTRISGDEITKEIGFNTDYAAAVHERLDAKHAVGQAKFLETAMRNNASKMAPFVASRIKAAGG